jgi:hypothetical protein
LAVRFSFNVRPGFFALTFCGDLPDMMAPSLVMADLASRRKLSPERRGRQSPVRPVTWVSSQRGASIGDGPVAPPRPRAML